jgi:hypothetical protein
MPRIIECDVRNLRILRKFLFVTQLPFFLQESRRHSFSKTTSLTLFFSGNSNVFRGTETYPQSITCENDTRGAREQHPISTGTLATEIKPTPNTTGTHPDQPSERCHPTAPLPTDRTCARTFVGCHFSAYQNHCMESHGRQKYIAPVASASPGPFLQ